MNDLFENKFADQPIYVAYGSNLNLHQMSHRCPDAEKIGAAYLPDWRLVFRGVADIEYSKGDRCPVALWRVTRKCEKALDAYEGFPTLYRKIYWEADGEAYMAYVMNRKNYAPPMKMYYEGIKEGYDDFNLPHDELEAAVSHSFRTRTGLGHVPKRYRTA
jgi:hypothetical protein